MGKNKLTATEMEAEAELLADISSRLNSLLDDCSWTVYKLINESHVSKNSVYNACKGNKGIQINTLFRICNTLDISLLDFFSYQVQSEDLNLSKAERIDVINRRKLDESAQQRISAYIQALVDEKESKKE